MGASDVPDDLLEALGDTDLAAITACLLRAAARRTPVLIDGPVAAAAALVAHRVQPRVSLWLRAATVARTRSSTWHSGASTCPQCWTYVRPAAG